MNEKRTNEFEEIIKNRYNNITGMVVMQGGNTVYEKYFNASAADERCHIFSVTKSIVSMLIGIAIDKGLIKSVNQRVLEFFPEYKVAAGEKALPDITLKHMLTMTAPYKMNPAAEPYAEYFASNDWVKSALDYLGGDTISGDFRYAPLIGPDIFNGIIAHVSGQSSLDFAKVNLFEPLGIDVGSDIFFTDEREQMAFYENRNIKGWVAGPTGVNTAGWGLNLTTSDLAKLGQLYLNNGLWNGHRIVSQEWIAGSTAIHSLWKETGLPYGYLWWVMDSGQEFAGIGDGGNVIFVDRKTNMVVAITSLFAPNITDRVEFINKHIKPAFAD